MNQFKRILICGIGILMALFNIVLPAEAIVGRDDVDEADYLLAEDAYPAVFDFFDSGGAGTMIAPEWAVTAAHVGRDIPQDGSHTVEIGGNRYAVQQVFTHPEWSQAHFNDIALVKLAEPVVGVEPIELYREQDEVGQVATLVGRGDFGTGLTGATLMDGRLRMATNVVEKVETGSIWFLFDDPGSPNVTPLEGVSGPGDSGGPAFLEVDGVPKIIGVSSFSIGLGEDPPGPGRYGIWDTYTNISSFQDWIDETMANGNGPAETVDNSAEQETEVVEVAAPEAAPVASEVNSETAQSFGDVNVYFVVVSAVIILALVGIIIVLWLRLKRLSQ